MKKRRSQPAGASQRGRDPGLPDFPSSRIPPILLEGDDPAPVSAGPGEKFSLGPHAQKPEPAAPLPEGYGTGRMGLVARDPHCLWAHWDLDARQQAQINAMPAGCELAVQIHPETWPGPAMESRVEPGARHCFVEVRKAGMSYVAVLGYRQPSGEWVAIINSGPANTPPDAPSPDTSVTLSIFAGVELPTKLEAKTPPGIGPLITPGVSWLPALDALQVASSPFAESGTFLAEELARTFFSGSPFIGQWTEAQHRLLEELLQGLSASSAFRAFSAPGRESSG